MTAEQKPHYIATVVYDGTGAHTTFEFSFPYLDKTTIGVYLNGARCVENKDYQIIDGGSITFNKPPERGVVVKIQRETYAAKRLVDFESGSAGREEDLDLITTQLMYLAQEAKDRQLETIQLDGNFQWDCREITLKRAGDAVDPTDLLTLEQMHTLAGDADSWAEQAKQAAEAAIAAKNAAEAYSESAQKSELHIIEMMNAASDELNQIASAIRDLYAKALVLLDEAKNKVSEVVEHIDESVTHIDEVKDEIDKYATSQFNLPIGAIVAFTKSEMPLSFLICDGSTISSNNYPDLVKYLTGSNAATEATLPDLRGHVLKGCPLGREVGSIEQDQVGQHQHAITVASRGAVDAPNNQLIIHGLATASPTNDPDENSVQQPMWGVEPVTVADHVYFLSQDMPVTINDDPTANPDYDFHRTSGVISALAHSNYACDPIENTVVNTAVHYGIKAFDAVTDQAITEFKDVLHQLYEALDAVGESVDPIPIGSIHVFPTDQIPDDYLLCNGRTIAKKDYPQLVEYLNKGGDSAVIPDYRDRFLRGANSAYIAVYETYRVIKLKELPAQQGTHPAYYCSKSSEYRFYIGTPEYGATYVACPPAYYYMSRTVTDQDGVKIPSLCHSESTTNQLTLFTGATENDATLTDADGVVYKHVKIRDSYTHMWHRSEHYAPARNVEKDKVVTTREGLEALAKGFKERYGVDSEIVSDDTIHIKTSREDLILHDRSWYWSYSREWTNPPFSADWFDFYADAHTTQGIAEDRMETVLVGYWDGEHMLPPDDDMPASRQVGLEEDAQVGQHQHVENSAGWKDNNRIFYTGSTWQSPENDPNAGTPERQPYWGVEVITNHDAGRGGETFHGYHCNITAEYANSTSEDITSHKYRTSGVYTALEDPFYNCPPIENTVKNTSVNFAIKAKKLVSNVVQP